ncbi:acyltransferase [Mycobacterium sp. CBMA271]|uniref:phthiocerol/phthiodiolone dimycocerosyl transferase family protein n=1 Tax=unclassified Mycobacteroides TaxID=2618759 RepID=UPI0012DD6A50|nr:MULTISPECIES: acyltransferase [unclassified Mycobacteroides]MUM17088.1 hypothetical protein [Mycobacteroides sp. CBMA 326]MUM23326.1 acyltransferase [Mycobacteroides sp. CBMA 271]
MPPTTPVCTRALDPSEKLFADVRNTVAYSVLGTGSIDIDVLTTAFTALRRSYPVLSAQIREVGDSDYDLVLTPAAHARIRIATGPVDALPEGEAAVVAEDEVCAVEVAQDGNDFRLTLLTHHSVADAMASLRYLQVLCELYTRVLESGGAGELTVHPQPRSVEQLLAANGIEKQPLPAEYGLPDPESLPAPPPRDPTPQHVRRGRVRLSPERTAALFALGREHGLTVHGIVASAVLLAAADLTGVTGPTTFTFMSAVDLRARLDPVVPAEGGTNVLGADNAVVTVDPGGDVFTMGRAVLDSIAANLANQTIHQGFLHQWDMREQMFELLARGYPVIGENAVMVTNWGAVPPLRLPADVRAHDFRGSFGAAMEDDRFAAKINVGVMSMIVTTFDDRLALEYQTWSRGGPDRTVAQTAALERAFDRLLG